LPWFTEELIPLRAAGASGINLITLTAHEMLSLVNFSKLGSETSLSQGMGSLSISPQRSGGSYGRRAEQTSIEAAQPNLHLTTLDGVDDRS
jgi:hypothetical protein